MDLQNAPFTIQLGSGANIRLANAVINTGNTGATIQFGRVDFPAIAAAAAAAQAPICGAPVRGPLRRPQMAKVPERRARDAPQPTQEVSRKRASVFERLGQSDASASKKVIFENTIHQVPQTVATMPVLSFAPGRHDTEASSSGSKLTRRQRRKRNAELRAQNVEPDHASEQEALQPEASVLIRNIFNNLNWVKMNNSTSEIKQSFWTQRQPVLAPSRRQPETLSAKVHRVLKVAKEECMMKRRYQRPLIIEHAEAPPRRQPTLTFTCHQTDHSPHGEHRSVTLQPRVQESAAERSRGKGKQIWRSKSQEQTIPIEGEISE